MKAIDKSRVRTLSRSIKQPSVEAQDLDHYDALIVVRDRCLGLRCAINGAGIAEDEDRNGMQQLVSDLIESFNELCSAFAEERGLQVRKR
jgi:hypothetical protein